MAIRGYIERAGSILTFRDNHGPINARSICSFVQWQHESGIVNGNDFTPEIVDIKNGGLDPDGRCPPLATGAICGFTPQCEDGENDDTKPNFVGGWVLQFEHPGYDPYCVQFAYVPVNEFFGGANTDKGEGLGYSICYRVDEFGNVQADIAVRCGRPGGIKDSIHNPHMVEVTGMPSLFDFDFLMGRYVGPGGISILKLPSEFFFPDWRAGKSAILMQDRLPKEHPFNTPYRLDPNTWMYTMARDVELLSPIIGVSRRSDGAGILMVHGNLSVESQPVIYNIWSDSQGVVPILSSWACDKFDDRSTTIYRLYWFPFTAQTRAQQFERAIALCNYENPISVQNW